MRRASSAVRLASCALSGNRKTTPGVEHVKTSQSANTEGLSAKRLTPDGIHFSRCASLFIMAYLVRKGDGLTLQLSIAGVAQSRYSAGHRRKRLEDMIFETAAAALADAGIEREGVDNIVLAASDMVDGRCISSMLTANAGGAYLKDEIKVADEGSYGLVMAALRLLTGHFHTSLVVSWSKPSEGPSYLGNNLMADPFYHRPFGLNQITTSAMLAGNYVGRYGSQEEAAAGIVAKNRANGGQNPAIENVAAVEIDEVLRSSYAAYPLRQLHIATPADGACALVLTTEERARDLPGPSVSLRGMGWAADSYYLGERDLSRFRALEIAAQRAYENAEITRPTEELDLAEVSEITAYHELLACEALGFCGQGEAGAFLDSGATQMDGRLPINPSGGCLSAHPVFCSGLTRIVEICLQLTRRASGHQIAGASLGLAHGCAGFAGQCHTAFVLSSD